MPSTERRTSSVSNGPTPWTWHVGEGLPEVNRLAPEWNRLAHVPMGSPTSSALWTTCAWAAFGSPRQVLRVHSVRDEEGQLLAVIPLVHKGGLLASWKGVPDVRHVPCWDFAFAENVAGVATYIVERLLESACWIDLHKVPTSGAAFAALTTSLAETDVLIRTDPVGQDAVLDLSGTWEELRESLPKRLVSNTEREIRRLNKMGQLRHQVLTNEEGLDRALGECFELETKGWKGQYGSPIARQPETLRFYTDLAHASARNGLLALCLLKLDDRLIAFDYCLRLQSRIELLKISYDPTLAKHSPGNVLRYLMLRDELERGKVSEYHMGLLQSPHGWKQRWASHVDDLVRLRIYRRAPRGIFTYLAGPWLRDSLKRIPTLKRAENCGLRPTEGHRKGRS